MVGHGTFRGAPGRRDRDLNRFPDTSQRPGDGVVSSGDQPLLKSRRKWASAAGCPVETFDYVRLTDRRCFE